MSLIVQPGIVANLQQLIKVPGAITLSLATLDLSSTGVATFAVAVPTGIQDGDILVIVTGSGYNGNASGVTLSSEGMTQLQAADRTRINGSGNIVAWAVKYVAATHGTTLTFTCNNNRSWSAFAMVITPLADVPLDAAGAAATTSTPIVLPDLTPVVPPVLGIEAFISRSPDVDQAVIGTPPAGAVEVYNARNTSHSDADAQHRLSVHISTWPDTDPTGTRSYDLTDLAITSTQYTAGVHCLLKS